MTKSSQNIAPTPDKVSGELLSQLKRSQAYQSQLDYLDSLDYQALTTFLNDEDAKLSFWINVYNSAVQILLQEKPDLYKKPSLFYTQKFIPIAGKRLNLDMIEHGILRRSQFKYGLGYIPKLFPSSIEKGLRVKKVNPLIHFALNCGAKSCPPILFYETASIQSQLKEAAQNYLEQESQYFPEKNTLEISKLLLWFRGDFGGKAGIIRMMKKFGILPQGVKPKLKYRKYDWTLAADNYQA